MKNEQAGATAPKRNIRWIIAAALALLLVAASGDPCEVVGSLNAQDNETYYCTPSSAGELAWASEEDFTAYQELELESLEAQAIQEAEAAAQELEEDLAAAEERAEAAETKVAEYQAQVEDYEEELAAAQEAAEEAAEEEARQSQPAPAGDAPTQELQPDNTGPTAPFENCTAAREADAAPVHRGEPGYGPHLDRDGDGIGCEQAFLMACVNLIFP